MIKNIVSNLTRSIILFSLALTTCYAKEKLEYTPHKNTIIHCINNNCSELKIPDSLRKNIEQDYDLLFIENFGNDDVYIIATSSNSNSANNCYISYQIMNGKISVEPINILPDNRELCDYKISNNKLFNRYKNGAKWYEEAYELVNNKYQIFAVDECLGCNFIQRTLFLSQNENYKMWVTDEFEFNKRIPILAKIKTNKSFIYKNPNDNSLTKNYLILEDEAEIIDEESKWIHIRYYNTKKGAITGWILKDTIEKSELIE